ncbi:MAG TPA: hypothetical protein VKJ45_16355 [Blastocatellia bacterium]|nr:hypothetical protein [Blastocatellia bacterium]
MDHLSTPSRFREYAAAFEKLTAVGYFLLGLSLVGIGLYGFIILLRLLSSHYHQFSI